MDISAADPALRHALDFPDGTPASEHARLVDGVRAQHPHDVHYVCAPERATCGMHALGLIGNPTYAGVARDFDIYAGAEFFAWLISTRLQFTDSPEDGDLAFYFMGDEWRHVGLIQRGRVCSK